MNKKDIFLLFLGILGGHLLSTYLRKKREKAEEIKEENQSK
jgi:hypothetical protein